MNIFAVHLDADDTAAGGSVQDGFIAADGSGTGADPLVSTIPEESTILRIRGSLLFPNYNIDDPIVAGAAFETCFGMGVAPIKDLDADSYPGPCSEASWDGWMFRRQSSLEDITFEGSIIDVKAMRKVKSGDAFFVMAEMVNISAVGTLDFDWQWDLRLLILLP